MLLICLQNIEQVLCFCNQFRPKHMNSSFKLQTTSQVFAKVKHSVLQPNLYMLKACKFRFVWALEQTWSEAFLHCNKVMLNESRKSRFKPGKLHIQSLSRICIPQLKTHQSSTHASQKTELIWKACKSASALFLTNTEAASPWPLLRSLSRATILYLATNSLGLGWCSYMTETIWRSCKAVRAFAVRNISTTALGKPATANSTYKNRLISNTNRGKEH